MTMWSPALTPYTTFGAVIFPLKTLVPSTLKFWLIVASVLTVKGSAKIMLPVSLILLVSAPKTALSDWALNAGA